MSIIKNEPTIQDEAVVALRKAFAHRARWMKLILDEVKAEGMDWEAIGRRAIHKCGVENGKSFREQMAADGLTDLPNFVGAKWARKIFEIEVLEESSERYYINFHHCPLVTGWQAEGCSDEEIQLLCDIAMDGDRGTGCGLGHARFSLGKTIAEGHSCCELRFDRVK